MHDTGLQQEGQASLSRDRHFEGITWEQTCYSEERRFPLETQQGRKKKTQLLACSSAQVKSSGVWNWRELLWKNIWRFPLCQSLVPSYKHLTSLCSIFQVSKHTKTGIELQRPVSLHFYHFCVPGWRKKCDFFTGLSQGNIGLSFLAVCACFLCSDITD